MHQSRLSSLKEALTNVAIGYTVMIGANLIILPAHGIDVSLKTTLSIGLWFTVVSVARTYVVRRFFNWMLHRGARHGAR